MSWHLPCTEGDFNLAKDSRSQVATVHNFALIFAGSLGLLNYGQDWILLPGPCSSALSAGGVSYDGFMIPQPNPFCPGQPAGPGRAGPG